MTDLYTIVSLAKAAGDAELKEIIIEDANFRALFEKVVEDNFRMQGEVSNKRYGGITHVDTAYLFMGVSFIFRNTYS